MAFDPVPFPKELSSLGVKSTWEDTVVVLGSGNEQRTALWDDAQRVYDAKAALNLTLADYRAIEKHFNARRGRLRSFPLRDRSSFQASTEPFGVGDGATTTFQLTVASGDSGNAYNREIYIPETGTISVFDNTVPVVEGAGAGKFTLAYTGATGGLVTFGTAPLAGHSLTWTGNYWIPVRYDTKSLDPTLFLWRQDGTGLVQGPSIMLLEVRYPGEWV